MKRADLHLINILNQNCPSSYTTYSAYPPPRCVPCCLVLSPLCGLLCVNHDSFCETVTLVSEVHRESTLALSLAGEFPLWWIVLWSSCFVCELKRICINYSLSSFSLWSIKLTSEKLMEYVLVCMYSICVWRGHIIVSFLNRLF